jgi:hypothetical protein
MIAAYARPRHMSLDRQKHPYLCAHSPRCMQGSGRRAQAGPLSRGGRPHDFRMAERHRPAAGCNIPALRRSYPGCCLSEAGLLHFRVRCAQLPEHLALLAYLLRVVLDQDVHHPLEHDPWRLDDSGSPAMSRVVVLVFLSTLESCGNRRWRSNSWPEPLVAVTTTKGLIPLRLCFNAARTKARGG